MLYLSYLQLISVLSCPQAAAKLAHCRGVLQRGWTCQARSLAAPGGKAPLRSHSSDTYNCNHTFSAFSTAPLFAYLPNITKLPCIHLSTVTSMHHRYLNPTVLYFSFIVISVILSDTHPSLCSSSSPFAFAAAIWWKDLCRGWGREEEGKQGGGKRGIWL